MRLIVPFHRQEQPHTCGPACLRMVLEYFGGAFSEEHLTVHCGTTAFGTERIRLADAATSLGYSSQLVSDIKRETVEIYLRRGIPMIVAVDGGLLYFDVPRFGHAVVVIGMEQDGVIYHDPELGPYQVVPWERFAEAWSSRGRKGVIVWKP